MTKVEDHAAYCRMASATTIVRSMCLMVVCNYCMCCIIVRGTCLINDCMRCMIVGSLVDRFLV